MKIRMYSFAFSNILQLNLCTICLRFVLHIHSYIYHTTFLLKILKMVPNRKYFTISKQRGLFYIKEIVVCSEVLAHFIRRRASRQRKRNKRKYHLKGNSCLPGTFIFSNIDVYLFWKFNKISKLSLVYNVLYWDLF